MDVNEKARPIMQYVNELENRVRTLQDDNDIMRTSARRLLTRMVLRGRPVTLAVGILIGLVIGTGVWAIVRHWFPCSC